MFSYLALGDSYTIGELVPLGHNFPYQTVQLLRNDGFDFYAPEIFAVTGWTSDELIDNLKDYNTLRAYDFISLLIGVNNQYRGKSLDAFEKDFEELVQKALHHANNREQNVFVLSIPDWGVTPFAEGREREKIASEIDAFNEICAKISRKYEIAFIEITEQQRIEGSNEEYLAADKLHPSGREYAKWAQKLFKAIKFSIVNAN